MLRAVLARDARFDRKFVYAVRTTGIYCRPSCPSRRPNPVNVIFYGGSDAARRAGYRPCRRCTPDEIHGSRAEKAVAVVQLLLDRAASDSSMVGQTKLKVLADRAGISPFHLQRHFKRLVGLTPRAYLTKQKSTQLRHNLRKGGTVLRASYESGFASPSSAYAAAARELGMSPSAYRKDGTGTEIAYWTTITALGHVIVAATERGVCAVMMGSSEREVVQKVRAEFPGAAIQKGNTNGNNWVKSIVKTVERGGQSRDVALDLAGSPFQWRVWEALRRIPIGETRTYGEIARAIGKPGAARAVGRACATNPAAVLIPCHRVVRGDGKTGEYRWGAERKKKLLAREANTNCR